MFDLRPSKAQQSEAEAGRRYRCLRGSHRRGPLLQTSTAAQPTQQVALAVIDTLIPTQMLLLDSCFLIFFFLLCASLLLEKMEKWLQLMLKWSPQERGKDRDGSPGECFTKLDDILKMKVM